MPITVEEGPVVTAYFMHFFQKAFTSLFDRRIQINCGIAAHHHYKQQFPFNNFHEY